MQHLIFVKVSITTALAVAYQPANWQLFICSYQKASTFRWEQAYHLSWVALSVFSAPPLKGKASFLPECV